MFYSKSVCLNFQILMLAKNEKKKCASDVQSHEKYILLTEMDNHTFIYKEKILLELMNTWKSNFLSLPWLQKIT